MNWDCSRTPHHGGSAPATRGFNAVAPEWLAGCGAAKTAAPAIPAAESTLGSHPCVAHPPLRCLQSGLHQPRRAILLQRTAITPLTSCLSPGVHFKLDF